MSAQSRPLALLALLVLSLACTTQERTPAVADQACFGGRVLSFHNVVAEVVIPAGETCGHGTFQVVFARGTDTLATLTESRHGTVGFIGTSDVNGDGRGEFFVATQSIDSVAAGARSTEMTVVPTLTFAGARKMFDSSVFASRGRFIAVASI